MMEGQDEDSLDSETDEEELFLATDLREPQSEEPLLTKKGNPVNLRKKGGVLWKKNFRKDKRNMRLLLPDTKPKIQLNRMWNELAEDERLEWMSKAAVIHRRKQETWKRDLSHSSTEMSKQKKVKNLDQESTTLGLKLSALDRERNEAVNRVENVRSEVEPDHAIENMEDSSSTGLNFEVEFVPLPRLMDLPIMEPLRTKNGTVISLERKGSQLWKMHFPKEHLDNRISRKTQLDSVWSHMCSEEQNGWIAEAEYLLRETKKLVRITLPTPRIPWSSFFFFRERESQEAADRVESVSSERDPVFRIENSDDDLELETPEERVIPQLMELPNVEHLRTKHGTLMHLGRAGLRLWKKHFPKEHLDRSIKRKTQLNAMWSNLSTEEKNAWIAEADFLLRENKKLGRITLPTPRIRWSSLGFFPGRN